ncbi:MAG TPA: LytTR family DNA-binding domain-containing protein [Puia sp.]|nr:LytTR family DNA-binding domain-containing protein [Puia sp.]
MEKTFTCAIIDDDDIDRLTALAHARKFPFIEIKGVYASAEEATAQISREPVQILLLDIDMPGMNGITLRENLLNIPVCIFITSYPDFAVESFEAAALDFIVKPFSAERFTQAMMRAKEYLEIKEKANLFEFSLGHDIIFIKQGYEKTKVKLHDILYLEALKDYTGIVTEQKKYCVLGSLGTMLQERNFKSFIRIHRSFAVQKHYIRKVDTNNVYIRKLSLPLGKTFKKNVEDLLE